MPQGALISRPNKQIQWGAKQVTLGFNFALETGRWHWPVSANQDEAKGCKLSEAVSLKEMCPGQDKGEVPRSGQRGGAQARVKGRYPGQDKGEVPRPGQRGGTQTILEVCYSTTLLFWMKMCPLLRVPRCLLALLQQAVVFCIQKLKTLYPTRVLGKNSLAWVR